MDILVVFALPTPTENERPLKGVRIEVRRDLSLEWVTQGFVDMPGTNYILADVSPGPYYIRGIVVDRPARVRKDRPVFFYEVRPLHSRAARL